MGAEASKMDSTALSAHYDFDGSDQEQHGQQEYCAGMQISDMTVLPLYIASGPQSPTPGVLYSPASSVGSINSRETPTVLRGKQHQNYMLARPQDDDNEKGYGGQERRRLQYEYFQTPPPSTTGTAGYYGQYQEQSQRCLPEESIEVIKLERSTTVETEYSNSSTGERGLQTSNSSSSLIFSSCEVPVAGRSYDNHVRRLYMSESPTNEDNVGVCWGWIPTTLTSPTHGSGIDIGFGAKTSGEAPAITLAATSASSSSDSGDCDDHFGICPNQHSSDANNRGDEDDLQTCDQREQKNKSRCPQEHVQQQGSTDNKVDDEKDDVAKSTTVALTPRANAPLQEDSPFSWMYRCDSASAFDQLVDIVTDSCGRADYTNFFGVKNVANAMSPRRADGDTTSPISAHPPLQQSQQQEENPTGRSTPPPSVLKLCGTPPRPPRKDRSSSSVHSQMSEGNCERGTAERPPTPPPLPSQPEFELPQLQASNSNSDEESRTATKTILFTSSQTKRRKIHDLMDQASQYEMQGDLVAALEQYEQCLSMLGASMRSNATPSSQQVGQVLACSSLGSAISIEYFQPPNETIAEVLHKVGVLHWKKGAYNESLSYLNHSLNVYKRCLQPVSKANTVVVENTLSTCSPKRMAQKTLKHNYEADILSNVLNSIGRVHLSLGEYDDAMRRYKRSLSVQRTAYAEDVENDESGNIQEEEERENTNEVVPTPTLTTADLVGSSIAQAKKDTKTQSKKRNRRRYPTTDHPGIARTTICIGMVHDARGKHLRAMHHYREGLRAQRATLGDEHVDVAATLNAIGSVHERFGEYEKAMECYTEALWIYRTRLGNDHVDVAVTLNNTGQVHHYWKEYDEAMKAYVEAIRVMRKVLGVTHRNVAATMHNIGLIHTAKGSHDKALKIYREVLKCQRNALGDDHVDVAITLDSIGLSYENKAKLDKARKFYGKALHVRRKALGKKHLYVAITLDRLGRFHLEKDGNLHQALRRFVEAKDVYQVNALSNDDIRMREVLENLSKVKNRMITSDFKAV